VAAEIQFTRTQMQVHRSFEVLGTMSSHPHGKTVQLLHEARELVARVECGQLSENEAAKALAAALLHLDAAIQTLQAEWKVE
jgi:hypothetical protein